MPDVLDQHSAAEIVRAALVGLGLATESGSWPARAGLEPDSPDEVITVYDVAGTYRGRTMPDNEPQGHYGVTIRVRALTHTSGHRKCRDLCAALDALYQRSVVIESVTYVIHSFNRTGEPVHLGKEVPESRRNLFTINGLLTIRTLGG